MLTATLTLFLAHLALSSAGSTDDAKTLGLMNGTSLGASEADIKIFYFSREMPNGIRIPHSDYKGAIEDTDFDCTKRTIFAIHGWHDSNVSPFCKEIREAYLHVADCNIFIIDWNDITKSSYFYARDAVPKVAVILGRLIQSLIDNHKLNLDNVVMVGHSLGAHVAGLAGAALHGQVDTIVGLDPAGPSFSVHKLDERLDQSDAKFVQGVHTCPGLLGVTYRVGRSDYYANNGRKQPGCGLDLTGHCAHTRSHAYFAESVISGKFISYHCDSYADLHAGSCYKNRKSEMGGYNVDKNATGAYYFETNAEPPYAKW